MIDEVTLAPGLLIAAPHLLDPNFRQAVVLLIEKNDDGAFGLVVNHESDLRLADLCRDQEIPYRGPEDKRVRAGGPVRPEHGLVLLDERHDDPDARPILEGLRFSASKETLRRLAGEGVDGFHCFAGFSGWGPGQLEQEIRAGVWVVGPACAETILAAPPDAMWIDALHELGIDPAAMVPSEGSEA